MTHREDVHCPACSDPETAFRIEDVGLKFDSGDLFGDGMRFRTFRPAWEPVMLDHLRSRPDDDEHRRLYSQCVAALTAAGVSAEESARNSVQAAVDSVRRSLDDALRRHLQPPAGSASVQLAPCCDMHNIHCEPPGDLCCHDCTEAAHDMFPVRHGDGFRCVLDEPEEAK